MITFDFETISILAIGIPAAILIITINLDYEYTLRGIRTGRHKKVTMKEKVLTAVLILKVSVAIAILYNKFLP